MERETSIIILKYKISITL